MVLQSSGAITLTNIQTEFGGTAPISISEYYAVATGIPASGTISISQFYGKSSIAGRGVFAGGSTPNPAPAQWTAYNTMDYVTISTAGNATDFGDLASGLFDVGSCSSTTRGLFAGGLQTSPSVSYYSGIYYITLATTGNTSVFGALSTFKTRVAGCSSPTRGVFAGGYSFVFPATSGTTYNTIEYVTIATLGNAIDFGDLTAIKEYGDGACSSPTRGVFIGGAVFNSSPLIYYNTIDYITIATTGNAVNFGTVSSNHDSATSACSSPTRGLFAGGVFVATAADAPLVPGSSYFSPTTSEYITIATTGNSTNFGNLNRYAEYMGGTSNSTRGIFGGGDGATLAAPGTIIWTNVIDYYTIATTGSSTDFGDLTVSRTRVTACSDSDGGLNLTGGGGGSIGPGVGLFGGGFTPGVSTNIIDYITIATTGNAQDFGDLFRISSNNAACSSTTRGVFAHENASGTTISYVTIATQGNSQSFGNLFQNSSNRGGCSSPTRGIFGGGFVPSPVPGAATNSIDYITIATTGNGQDFGDLTVSRYSLGSCSSPTRGVFAGGASTVYQNTIDYITIATTGNAQDFGDLFPDALRNNPAGCSSSTRGVFAGGFGPSAINSNVISYITIATIGSAQDFGDLTGATINPYGCSSPTRGVFAGGQRLLPAPTQVIVNNIDYITIANIGNAQDFGDLTIGRSTGAACSDSHGGLV